MIGVAVLGSTGSIGRSTLDVVARHPGRFRIVGLCANRSVDRLAEQVREVEPPVAVVADPETPLPRGGEAGGTTWRRGRAALLELARDPRVDVVVNAVVGAAGLEPTLESLRAGKRLALANKESLVAGGPLVMEAARSGELIPVDSEHSAILQCLEGYDRRGVARLVLTASGGPFRDRSLESLRTVGPVEALKHPTWSMGAKITVDSATLANKALEVIEAHFLYGIPYDRIDVVVHPQSIVHSFVEFVDGSVLAQVGEPTMELPILYALSYPERIGDPSLCTFDPVRASPLTFEEVDSRRFPLFELGIDAGRRGGTAPAVFNAANEVAVQAFLDQRIAFLPMADVVEAALEAVDVREVESVEDVARADRMAREAARRAVGSSFRPAGRAGGIET